MAQCSLPKCELAPCDWLVVRISPAVSFLNTGRNIVFSLVTRLRNARPEKLWFDSWEGKEFSLLHDDQKGCDVHQHRIR